ncbi:hypothetical protein ACLK17_00380 [Escherichia coli]
MIPLLATSSASTTMGEFALSALSWRCAGAAVLLARRHASGAAFCSPLWLAGSV